MTGPASDTTHGRRLVVVFGWIAGGGALRSTLEVIQGTRDRFGSVVAVSCLEGSTFDRPLDDAVDVRVRLDEHRSPLGVLRAARRLSTLLADDDVVLLVARPAQVVAGLALRLRGRLVGVLHSDAANDRAGLQSRLEDVAVRRALRRATVVAVSSAAADSAVAARLVTTRPSVLPNPPATVAAPLRPPRPGVLDEMTVAIVGRLQPIKQIPELLDLMSSASSNFEDIRFVVAGDGPDRPRLNAAAARAAAAGLTVELLGYVLDPWSVYDDADVVAIPSSQEGACLVRYEAWQRGRPVIALPLSVFNPADGPMLLTEFNVDGWREAFERVRTDPALRASAFRGGPAAVPDPMPAWRALLAP